MAGASASSDTIEDNPNEVVLEVLGARPHPTITVQAPHHGLIAGRPDLHELGDSHVRGERKHAYHCDTLGCISYNLCRKLMFMIT